MIERFISFSPEIKLEIILLLLFVMPVIVGIFWFVIAFFIEEIREKQKNRRSSEKDIVKIAYQIRSGELKETKEILMLQNKDGISVAHELACRSNKTGWSTNDKEVLMLQNEDGWSVAHRLALYHSTWTTDDLEILSLINQWGTSVEDRLIEKGKI